MPPWFRAYKNMIISLVTRDIRRRFDASVGTTVHHYHTVYLFTGVYTHRKRDCGSKCPASRSHVAFRVYKILGA